jgi:hypothetical protein
MANKNVGDAFLLSWKLCDGDLEGFSLYYRKPKTIALCRAKQFAVFYPT